MENQTVIQKKDNRTFIVIIGILGGIALLCICSICLISLLNFSLFTTYRSESNRSVIESIDRNIPCNGVNENTGKNESGFKETDFSICYNSKGEELLSTNGSKFD